MRKGKGSNRTTYPTVLDRDTGDKEAAPSLPGVGKR